jgi:hypothetical protein
MVASMGGVEEDTLFEQLFEEINGVELVTQAAFQRLEEFLLSVQHMVGGWREPCFLSC